MATHSGSAAEAAHDAETARLPPSLRIFISSPSDVRPEREIAKRLVEKMNREFFHYLRVEPVLWEREALKATEHFQASITRPHETDIVVVILWSRLGMPLPETQFSGAITGRRVTGTEWEFEDAFAAYRKRGQPELLFYLKTAEITGSLEDEATVLERLDQKKRVQEFMKYWFEDAETKTFKLAYRTFADTAELEEILETHLRGLLKKRIKLAEGEKAQGGIHWHQGSPYRGLESFALEHAQLFFGRTRARNELRETLARQAASGCAFVLVFGASGSGKSSLVKAGLLPDLKLPGMIGQVALCRHAILRPADAHGDLLGYLAAALLGDTALPELTGLQYDRAGLAELLREAPGQAKRVLLQGIVAAKKAEQLAERAEARLALVVDQLEELFTLEGLTPKARTAFVVALEALAASGLVWVVATMRSDFFDRLERLPVLAQLSAGEARYLLTLPTPTEIGQIVREPAREAGLRFEFDPARGLGLDDDLCQAAAQAPSVLPLLEFTLDQLWQRRTEENELSFAAYRELGGLEGALGRRAEEELSKLPPEVQEALPQVLRALATVGQGIRETPTARVVPLAAFVPDSPRRRLVEAFLAPQARLLVADRDKEKGEQQVRVAHEALLTHWQRAKEQLASDKADLQTRARLEQAAGLWQNPKEADHTSRLLPMGLPLAEAEDLLHRRRDELDLTVVRYVEASIAAAQAQAQRSRRRLQATVAGFAVLAIAALIGAALAYLQRNAATERLSKLHWVNGVFARDNGNDALKASHHFMEAAELAGGGLQSRNAYLAGALLMRGLRLDSILDHDGKVLVSAVFGHDPQQIWTWDKTGTGRVWDLRDGKILRTVAFAGNPQSVTASGLGGWLMGRDSDANVRVVDARSGRLVSTRGQKQGWPAFNDDESKLASWTDEGQVGIFDLIKAEETAKLQAPYQEIRKVVLSHSGERVLVMGKDNTITLFRNGDSGASCRSPTDAPIVGALFSPDDNRMFSWTKDGSAFLWDTRSGCKSSDALTEHAENPPIMDALFSGNSRFIFTWNFGAEGALSRWDADTGRVSITFQSANGSGECRESSAIRRGGLNKDESRLLTSSDDCTARLRDAGSGKELRVFEHMKSVRGAVFNGAESRVLTWSDDGSARLWDADTGESIGFPLMHSNRVRSARFSEDGKHILTWGEDNTARLWMVEDQPVDRAFKLPEAPVAVFWEESEGKLSVLTNHGNLEEWSEQGERLQSRHLEDEILGGQFNHDGSRILTRSRDQTVRLWNTGTGQPVTPQLSHPKSAAGILGVGYSPDEQWILSWGDDHAARVWNSRNGDPALKPMAHEAAVKGAIVNADRSRILTWSDERLVRLWDAHKGTVLQSFEHSSGILGATFLTNSSEILMWASDGVIEVRDVKSGSVRRVFHHADTLNGAVTDGSRLLSWSGDGAVRLWDAGESEREVCPTLREPSVAGGVLNAEESPILTWSEEGNVHLWDSRTGQPLTKTLRHDKALAGASLSHDASRILAWSRDGWVKVWHLNVPPSQSPVLQQQLRSGTRLNSLGDIDVLDADAWKELTNKHH